MKGYFGSLTYVPRCGRTIGHFTVQWLDTFCQGVKLSLLAFLVSSGDLEIRTGRSMADVMSLPRTITNDLLRCGQTHSEPTRESPRS